MAEKKFLIDIDMGGNKITALKNPTSNQDAVTKIYADGFLSLMGGTMEASSKIHFYDGIYNNWIDSVGRYWSNPGGECLISQNGVKIGGNISALSWDRFGQVGVGGGATTGNALTVTGDSNLLGDVVVGDKTLPYIHKLGVSAKISSKEYEYYMRPVQDNLNFYAKVDGTTKSVFNYSLDGGIAIGGDAEADRSLTVRGKSEFKYALFGTEVELTTNLKIDQLELDNDSLTTSNGDLTIGAGYEGELKFKSHYGAIFETSVSGPEPIQDSHLVTKKYVDDNSGGAYLPLAGGHMDEGSTIDFLDSYVAKVNAYGFEWNNPGYKTLIRGTGILTGAGGADAIRWNNAGEIGIGGTVGTGYGLKVTGAVLVTENIKLGQNTEIGNWAPSSYYAQFHNRNANTDWTGFMQSETGSVDIHGSDISMKGKTTMWHDATFKGKAIGKAPTEDLHFATKKYVDDNSGGAYLPLAGGEMGYDAHINFNDAGFGNYLDRLGWHWFNPGGSTDIGPYGISTNSGDNQAIAWINTGEVGIGDDAESGYALKVHGKTKIDGGLEMFGSTPYIDFHYGNSTSDFTHRILAQNNKLLMQTGHVAVKAISGSESKLGVESQGGERSFYMFANTNNKGIYSTAGGYLLHFNETGDVGVSGPSQSGYALNVHGKGKFTDNVYVDENAYRELGVKRSAMKCYISASGDNGIIGASNGTNSSLLYLNATNGLGVGGAAQSGYALNVSGKIRTTSNMQVIGVVHANGGIGNGMGNNGLYLYPPGATSDNSRVTSIGFKNSNASGNFGYTIGARRGTSASDVNADFEIRSHNNNYSGIQQFNVGITNQAWFSGNVSVASLTDRTPYPKDKKTAYDAVHSIGKLGAEEYDENDSEKQLDHSTLHPFLQSEVSEQVMISDDVLDDDGEVIEEAVFEYKVSTYRNLSATVSAQNEVIKDLIKRLDAAGL